MFAVRKSLLATFLSFFSVGIAIVFAAASYRDVLTVPEYEIESGRPGITFMLAGDIHNHSDEFGDGSSASGYLRRYCPDYLFLTGDLIDSHTSSFDYMVPMLEAAEEIGAGIYYVLGNHEGELPAGRVAELNGFLEGFGAVNVESKTVTLQEGYTLSGILDPSILLGSDGYSKVQGELDKLEGTFDKEDFNIVLCHQPEFTLQLSQAGFDLALSGHTHGGQGQIGDYALFSHSGYFHGLYTRGSFAHIVTAGIGTSYYLPVRFCQTGELPFVTLS